MRIKDGYVKREIAGEKFVFPTINASVTKDSIFMLNESGERLWDLLLSGLDKDGMINAMTSEYDIDRVTVEKDIDAFISELRTVEILED